MLIKGDREIIEETLREAHDSPRKRAVYCFHKSDETLQRMINAMLRDTYVRPHKHENPDKLETFFILRGDVAVLTFDNNGTIDDKVVLREFGDNKVAEIPPRTWHSLIVLSPEAAVYEIIDGKYDPMTHKNFAPWAPSEDDPSFEKYRDELRRNI
ncbi:MAG: WbuC family cupin fold metalloprotein [Nanoarchaeota archaeon]